MIDSFTSKIFQLRTLKNLHPLLRKITDDSFPTGAGRLDAPGQSDETYVFFLQAFQLFCHAFCIIYILASTAVQHSCNFSIGMIRKLSAPFPVVCKAGNHCASLCTFATNYNCKLFHRQLLQRNGKPGVLIDDTGRRPVLPSGKAICPVGEICLFPS